jgi:adenine/guanine phosphoribosyltransferase-like PRPP-binding protein
MAMAGTTGDHGDLLGLVMPVADFPIRGVMFRDLTPLMADPAALGRAVVALARPFRCAGIRQARLTGGTAAAAVERLGRLGARLAGAAFLLELPVLQGRARLAGIEVHSVLQT